MATTDTVRTAATVYFAARRIISELPIHRDTVLSHAPDVDRAANELGSIEKLRARITRRASSGADTSQELAMIESALESAESDVTAFHNVAMASVQWAEKSLSLLGDADTPEMRFPAVHAVWGWVALFADALKTATRESPPRRNEHAIRAVVEDQKCTIDRIRKVLPDETLVPLRKRADDEWVLAKMNAANKPNVGGGDPASEKPAGEPAVETSDGPVAPDGFQWNGALHRGIDKKLTPQLFAILNALWDAPHLTLSGDDLNEAMGDRNCAAEWGAIKMACRRLNIFLEESALPFKVSGVGKFRTIRLNPTE